MKVSVTLSVEFDAEDWKAANGMSPDASASEVRQSAKDYSEAFDDLRDVRNMWEDIVKTDGVVRFKGVEASEDGEAWEPHTLVI